LSSGGFFTTRRPGGSWPMSGNPPFCLKVLAVGRHSGPDFTPAGSGTRFRWARPRDGLILPDRSVPARFPGLLPVGAISAFREDLVLAWTRALLAGAPFHVAAFFRRPLRPSDLFVFPCVCGSFGHFFAIALHPAGTIFELASSPSVSSTGFRFFFSVYITSVPLRFLLHSPAADS